MARTTAASATGQAPDGALSTSPRTAAAMTTTRASADGTSPVGIGLPGLWPASWGASTTSLSDPIDACRAVIATPSRRAIGGSAPATVATAATTRPSSRDGKGWVRRIRPPTRAAAGSASDVDDLVEVLDQVLDEAITG